MTPQTHPINLLTMGFVHLISPFSFSFVPLQSFHRSYLIDGLIEFVDVNFPADVFVEIIKESLIFRGCQDSVVVGPIGTVALNGV